MPASFFVTRVRTPLACSLFAKLKARQRRAYLMKVM